MVKSKDQLMLEQAYTKIVNTEHPQQPRYVVGNQTSTIKNKDQILLEQAYVQMGLNISRNELRRLIEMDHIAIEQLVEEGFGDILKKAGSAIKGGLQNVKQKLSSGIINAVVNTIAAAMPEQTKQQLILMIAKGTLPQEAKQVVDEIQNTPDTASIGATAPQQTLKKESLQQNKEYIASFIFTESNVMHLLEELQSEGLLLTEMQSVGIPTPSSTASSSPAVGRKLQRYANEVIAKINELYPKNKKALAAAMPGFVSKVSKGLNVPIGNTTTTPTPAATPAEGAPTPTATPAAALGAGAAAPENLRRSSGQGGAPATGGTGLIGKIMGYVKKYPKISAGVGVVILGLVASAFLGTAPVLVPALITAFKGSLLGGGGNLLKQIIGNKLQGNMAFDNVDFKAAGKAALSGAVMGAISSVLISGLGNIVKALTPITTGATGANNLSAPAPDTSMLNKQMSTNPGLKEVFDDLTANRNPADRQKAEQFFANISPQDLRSITPKGNSPVGIEIAIEIAKTLMNAKR